MNLENTLGMLQWLTENLQQADEAIDGLTDWVLCFDYPEEERLKDKIRLDDLKKERDTMHGMYMELVDYLHKNYRMSWDC